MDALLGGECNDIECNFRQKKSVNTLVKTLSKYMVPWAGVEPARSFERGILSPLRLPISPPRQINLISHLLYIKIKNMPHLFIYLPQKVIV